MNVARAPALCTAQQIVASAARWRAREGKSTVFQASLARGKRRQHEITVSLLRGWISIETPSAHAYDGASAEKRNRRSKNKCLGRSRKIWRRLPTWLKKNKVRQVAMESTGCTKRKLQSSNPPN